MHALILFLLCVAGTGATTVETTPLGEAVISTDDHGNDLDHDDHDDHDDHEDHDGGCARVAATAAITITTRKQRQHMLLPTNEAPGAQEFWEEEYDDWDSDETDADDSESLLKPNIAASTEKAAKEASRSENFEIQLELRMHEEEKPRFAALGFVVLYGLDKNMLPHLTEMLLWDKKRRQENVQEKQHDEEEQKLCTIRAKFFTKSILVTQYEGETVMNSVRRYTSEIYRRKLSSKEYPHPIHLLRSFEQRASLPALIPTLMSSTKNSVLSELLEDIFSKLPSIEAASRLMVEVKAAANVACPTRQQQQQQQQQQQPTNQSSTRRRKVAEALFVRATGLQKLKGELLGDAGAFFFEAGVLAQCDTKLAVNSWLMFGAVLSDLVSQWESQPQYQNQNEMINFPGFAKFPTAMEAAQMGTTPESKEWMRSRSMQACKSKALEKSMSLAKSQNEQNKSFELVHSEYETRVQWAELLVSTGSNVKRGLQVLNSLCYERSTLLDQHQIPRGSACNSLGNALYRSLGQIEKGSQAYRKAWETHEHDRVQSLLALHEAAGQGDGPAKRRATQIRVTILNQLPSCLLNFGTSLVAIGKRQEARESWLEGTRRGWFPHRMQHGSVTLTRGLTARPYWTESQVNLEKAFRTLSSMWMDIATEASVLSISSKLWTPSDNLYLRNIDQGGTSVAPVWQQIKMGNGTMGSSCAAVPVLCSVVKRIVKSSGGAVTSAKLSALWCDKCEILPHCGPTTEHLRILVPLVVPTGAMFDILVGNISPPQKLTLGQPLIFDDSIEHTVRYATPTTSLTTGKLPPPRIVLLLDVEHPDHGGNS